MTNFLTGALIDRASALRKDAAWIEERLVRDETRFLLLRDGNPLVRSEGAELHLVGRGDLSGALCGSFLFLGTAEGDVALFALEHEETAGEGEFRDFRSVVPLLPRGEGALVAYARGVFHWRRRHRHCGICGGATETVEGGHVLRCAACSVDHYPRTDPAVIVLITSEKGALLGRQPSWPKGVYSVLAGFVEPGESLEEAVRREVREESGIEVGEVRYRSSQPWPFPSSLMLGFRGEALSTEIRVDREELEDARWMTRSALRESVTAGEVRLPSPASIARRLVEEWLAEEGA